MTTSTFWPTGPTGDVTLGSGGFTKYTSDTYVWETLDEDNATYASRAGTSKNTWYGNKLAFTISSVIPADATVTSVTLTTEWYCSADDSSGPVLRLGCEEGGSSIATTSDTSGQVTVEVLTYAGTTPTLAQLRSSTFYATLEFERTDNTAHVAYVDYVKLVVVWDQNRTADGAFKLQAPILGGSATASQPIADGGAKLQLPLLTGTATNELVSNDRSGDGTSRVQLPLIGGSAKTLPLYESDLTSLSGGTTYHVRAWASNSDGVTGYGTEVDFTTDYTATAGVKLQLPLVGGTATASQPLGDGALELQSPLLAGTATASQPIATGEVKLQAPLIAGTATNVIGSTADGGLELQLPLVGGSAHADILYESDLSSLSAGVTYHVRAWATNSDGAVGYGSEVDFTTVNQGTGSVKPSLPSVGGTATASQPVGTGGLSVQLPLLDGTATNVPLSNDRSGSGEVRVQLPVISGSGTASQPLGTGSVTLQLPLIGGTATIASETAGVQDATGAAILVAEDGFVSSLADLNQSTHYYVRSWAQSEDGIGYGDTVEFTTTATPENPERIGSATLQGAYETDATGSAEVVPPAGYVSLLDGLEAGTHYYVRAWAENTAGISYGSAVEFDTDTVTDGDAEGSAVLRSQTQTGERSGSAELAAPSGYVSALTPLTEDTHYYVRAWAQNDVGVSYGAEVEFDTPLASESDAEGSATLATQALALGSAQLRQLPGTESFRGLLGMLLHTRRAKDFAGLAGGSATLRAAVTGDVTGTATLEPEDMLTGTATGSAIIELPVVVFRGLMGMLFHARRTGIHVRSANGSAVLQKGVVPEVGYAYGSAFLLRVRSYDANGEAQLVHDDTPEVDAEGGANLLGPHSADHTGSAVMAIDYTSDGDGSAFLVEPLTGSNTGSANLIDFSDGGITGSASLADGYSQAAYGSAMLRTLHKGKTQHPQRTDTLPTLSYGNKVGHMRRRPRKGMMDKWP